jgi:hypothetical protein
MPASRKSKDSAVSETAEPKKTQAKAADKAAEPKAAEPKAAEPKAAKTAKKAEPKPPRAADKAVEPEVAEDAVEDAAPLNRAERRALARGKGKATTGGKAQASSSVGVHPHTGPATTQRQWSNRRSGG